MPATCSHRGGASLPRATPGPGGGLSHQVPTGAKTSIAGKWLHNIIAATITADRSNEYCSSSGKGNGMTARTPSRPTGVGKRGICPYGSAQRPTRDKTPTYQSSVKSNGVKGRGERIGAICSFHVLKVINYKERATGTGIGSVDPRFHTREQPPRDESPEQASVSLIDRDNEKKNQKWSKTLKNIFFSISIFFKLFPIKK